MKRARSRSLVLALLGSLALAAPASAAAPPAGSVRLSDGRTFAHWAHPENRATVRQLPSSASRRIARIHYLTEDGFPEVYPVLRSLTGRDGRTWLLIRLPMRPNGRTGWVRDTALGPLYEVRTRLVVDRGRLRATLYRSGRPIWRSPIGVGTAATPTPAGDFWIREKFRVADAGGPYGPRALGTSAYSSLSDWPGGGVVGIHGTDQPGLVPGRPSHGCVRVPNRAIGQLYRLIPIGTPVHVL
jgi:lipoprotein-anchoring transpeptidase ErfK/SrfK